MGCTSGLHFVPLSSIHYYLTYYGPEVLFTAILVTFLVVVAYITWVSLTERRLNTDGASSSRSDRKVNWTRYFRRRKRLKKRGPRVPEHPDGVKISGRYRG